LLICILFYYNRLIGHSGLWVNIIGSADIVQASVYPWKDNNCPVSLLILNLVDF